MRHRRRGFVAQRPFRFSSRHSPAEYRGYDSSACPVINGAGHDTRRSIDWSASHASRIWRTIGRAASRGDHRDFAYAVGDARRADRGQPIRTRAREIAVVHNCIIENYEGMREAS